MNKPDQFQTTDNLSRVANEATAWISFFNTLSAAMEGKIRGYRELVKTLPESPVAAQLMRQLEWDVKAIDDLRKQGPIFPAQ